VHAEAGGREVEPDHLGDGRLVLDDDHEATDRRDGSHPASVGSAAAGRGSFEVRVVFGLTSR
jgi:hypothetical protein